jgi:transcription elongation factor Elf1
MLISIVINMFKNLISSPYVSLLFVSITITGVLSAIIALCLFLVFGLHFWASFALAFILQVAAYQVINIWAENQAQKRLLEREKIETQKRGKLTTSLTCAYCSEPNIVPIFLDTNENTFVCSKCNKVNKVFYQFATSQILEEAASIEELAQEMAAKSEFAREMMSES